MSQAEALHALIRFLGLVGLAALLLGSVGVASAVHVFMAVFSTLAGLVVLVGAVATSRFQRMREIVLLKTHHVLLRSGLLAAGFGAGGDVDRYCAVRCCDRTG